jgi:predicted transcriptional regulator
MTSNDTPSTMRPRCEIIVQYILPAIRAEMAIQMQKQGISQTNIAKTLGVTPAAVSQYLKSKRGATEQDNEILKVIDEFIKEYKTNPDALGEHLCEVCNRIKVLLDKRENTESGFSLYCS